MKNKELIKQLLNYPMDMEIDNEVNKIIYDSKPIDLCRSCKYFDRKKENKDGYCYCKFHKEYKDKYNTCYEHKKKDL